MNTTTDDALEAQPPQRIGFGHGLAIGVTAGMIVGVALAAVVALALPSSLLMSWRSDQSGASPTPTESPTPTPTPLPSDAWLDSATSLPLDVTQPGAVLTLGDPATVQLAGADSARTLIEITTVSVEQAPEKDQRTLRATAPVLTGQSVYYAIVTAQWVAGDPLASTALGDVFAMVDSAGVVIPTLTLLDWSACPPPVTPANFSSLTESTHWCIAAASPVDGLVPAGVVFSQSGGPYDSAEADASVRWMP